MEIRRVEGAQRKWCWKTSVFLSRETGMPRNSVGRIKGAKYRFDLQFLTWDFSSHTGAAAREPPRDSPVLAEMRAFVSCMA